MLRTYHRWLSVFFGIFLLWIGVTGVMIQIADLKAGGDKHEQHQPAASKVAPAFTCPADMTCRPRLTKNDAQYWVNFLQHLHSGENFGPLGTAISILSGLALMFFAGSGLWMYLQMWRGRNSRNVKPGWFW